MQFESATPLYFITMKELKDLVKIYEELLLECVEWAYCTCGVLKKCDHCKRNERILETIKKNTR